MFDFLFYNDDGDGNKRCLQAGMIAQEIAVKEHYQQQIDELRKEIEELRNIDNKSTT